MARMKLVIALFVGASAAFAGLWLIPAASADLGPSVVGVRARPGTGETQLQIAPLGTVNADTQRSPITIEVALEEVRFEELGPLAITSTGRKQLQDEVKADIKPLIVRTGLQLGIGMVVMGLLAGALLFRRELWPTVAGTAGAVIVAIGVLASTGITYDIEGFQEPRFTGDLERARGVIDAVQQNAGLIEEAGDRFEAATRRAAALLALLAQPDEDPGTASTAILHVSDIHGNPIGLDVTEELATEFEVDAIVDTGDLASSAFDTGELSKLSAPLEHSLVRDIGRLPAPYIFIAGNHDSFDLRDALEEAPNVEYLDNDTVTIGTLEIFGWADPTYSPEDIDASDKAEARIEEGEEVAAAVDTAGPDILAVHDPRLGLASIGHVPVILTGHTHERALTQENDTTILTVGSTGATGLNAFTVEAERDYQAEVIYFENGTLVGVDYVHVGSLGSEFLIERTTLP
jgi:predicted phosphodiesterase